jgi:hypothetical protein
VGSSGSTRAVVCDVSPPAPVAEAPFGIHRRAGLLALGSRRLADRLPEVGPQWLTTSAGLADYSGGPAPDLHRFPFWSRGSVEPRYTCRYREDRMPHTPSGKVRRLPASLLPAPEERRRGFGRRGDEQEKAPLWGLLHNAVKLAARITFVLARRMQCSRRRERELGAPAWESHCQSRTHFRSRNSADRPVGHTRRVSGRRWSVAQEPTHLWVRQSGRFFFFATDPNVLFGGKLLQRSVGQAGSAESGRVSFSSARPTNTVHHCAWIIRR